MRFGLADASLFAATAALFAAAAASPVTTGLLARDGYVAVGGVRLTAGVLYWTPWILGGVLGGVAAILLGWRRGSLTPAAVVAGLLFTVGLLFGANWQFRLEYLPLPQALLVPPDELLSGGMRLPLGMLVGGLLAGIWCAMTGVPWRDLGDAMAILTSVLIAVGRCGCLLVGCCAGIACAPWFGALCARYPAGTEPYVRQLQHGLVAPTAAWSLPAHPLPLYFGLSSVATSAMLLWLLRRNAAPGAILAAFLVLRSAAKVAFEPLRAEPRPAAMMIGIPAAMLVGTLGVLAWIWWRRAASRWQRPTTPVRAPIR